MMTVVAISLKGQTGAIIVAVLVALAVLAFVAMVVAIFGRRSASVTSRIEGYDLVGTQGEAVAEPAAFESSFMTSAVGMTERLATRFGLFGRIESALEQSEIPLRAGEIIFLCILGTIISGILAFILSANILIALIVMMMVGSIPLLLLSRVRAKTLRLFEEQLPDVLTLLAGTLRSGFSLLQGLEVTAKEAPEPASREFLRAYQEARMGRSIDECLNDVADRMESADLGWTVVAINIQQEVGGNLAELLDTISNTMNQRERLRREVRALTGEGRFSAIVLFIFPIAFAAIMYALQPGYISKLFNNTGGIIACVVAATLMVIGGLWLKKIVKLVV